MMLTKTLPLYLLDESHPQAQVCKRCEVRRNALFGALDAASLESIHANISSPEVAAEHRIYGRGAQGDVVYTVRSGIVRFERVTEGGVRRIVRLAGPGDLIGQESLLSEAYRDDAVACTPVALCRIPVPLLERLSAEEDALLRELMRRWQAALDDAQSWSAELTAGPARRRVLKLLQLLQRHAEDQQRIWLPRRDQMGDMLGMTVETASRTISRLRSEAVLELLPPQQARLDSARVAQALQAIDA